jgi:hypothetical protein
MSVAELKAQVEGLSLDERRQLTAFLVSLRHREMEGYRQKIAEKIDDKTEAGWVSFEEFDRRVSA